MFSEKESALPSYIINRVVSQSQVARQSLTDVKLEGSEEKLSTTITAFFRKVQLDTSDTCQFFRFFSSFRSQVQNSSQTFVYNTNTLV